MDTDIDNKEEETKPTTVYMLWVKIKSSFNIIGVYSSIPKLAKSARNYFPKRHPEEIHELYVTTMYQDYDYGEVIDLDRISWKDFYQIQKVRDTIRKG